MSNYDLSTSVDDLSLVIGAIDQALQVSEHIKALSAGLDELVEQNDSRPVERFYDIQGEHLSDMTDWLERLGDVQKALYIQRNKLEEAEAMTI